MRAAIIHVIADAAVSVLVIVGLILARTFGCLWMDPLAGIVGACVIASWSYGLIRDTGAILLDRIPDSNLARSLRETLESDGSATLPRCSADSRTNRFSAPLSCVGSWLGTCSDRGSDRSASISEGRTIVYEA